MKTIILLVAVIFISTSEAQVFTHETQAVVRNERHRARTQDVILEDLVSPNSFDGLYFKIVVGKGEEPISFDAENDLVFRASTVYYHLTRARKYFVERIGSSYVKGLPKLTIRIDHFNQFSELGHFANDNYDPQYNNALTVPGGKGLARKGIRPWGMEIWFRPSKEIHISEVQVHDADSAELKGLFSSYRKQVHMQTLSMFLAQLLLAYTKGGSSIPLQSVYRMSGSSIMIESFYQFSDPLNKLFRRRWYHLDTALVPEIIYHEYSHAALSDHLVLSHSTAVIEGMADFFAGQIGNTKKLAKHIRKYNTYSGKKASKKKEYKLAFEHGDYANSDFVFGLLWELKDIVGENSGAPFIYSLRRKLTTDSSIRNQLIEGILKTCEERCENPRVDKLRILKALNDRNI